MITLHRSRRALGALVLAVSTMAACTAPTGSMPSVHTSKVNIPGIPLASVTNMVLDPATFDEAASAACAAGGDAATSDGFYNSFLGQWAVKQLASKPTTLAEQQKYLGALFTSGYYGGQWLYRILGKAVALSPQVPFSPIAPLVKSQPTVVLDALAGRLLFLANGDAAAVAGPLGQMAPILSKVAAMSDSVSKAPGVPANVQPLLKALVASVGSVSEKTQAGLGGDTASGRQAVAAATGMLMWGGGYYTGVNAPPSEARPTLTCG